MYSIFNVRYETGRDYRVPPLNFFRHCATFFSNFLLSPNGPPFKFFDILQQTEVSKSPKGPPFQVFRHSETFKILIFRFFESFSKKFPNFLIVSFNFFDILQQTGFWKSWKGTPFYKFKNLALCWALDIAPTLDVPVLFVITGLRFPKKDWVNKC